MPDDPNDHRRMSVAEFRRLGYLQEVNRRLLHPVGLALEVVIEEDGTEHFGGIWDYRDDPEGIIYSPDTVIDGVKVRNYDTEANRHADSRRKLLGDVVQPPPPD